jgi:uncharacterized protein (TIGR02597 family)
MRKKIFYFLTGIALAMGTITGYAQTATVATVPEGLITYSLAQGSTNYVSLPLTDNVTYTSAVTAMTANTITVGDSPAPFTTSLATAGSPYFVKFLSGREMGRVMLITANTTSSLTLDTTDNSIQTVNLTTSGFSVAVGDTFEIFPGNTLASMFGNNTTENPLLLNGSTGVSKADTIGIYNPALVRFQTYYFNTKAGYWEQSQSTANANNTVLYPYGSLTITRRASQASTSFALAGRVSEVPILVKTTGSSSEVYGSTGYATNMTLSQLQLGSNWVTGTSPTTADTIGVWDQTLNRFDTYYQTPNLTWRQSHDTTTDMSSTVLAAGGSITLLQRASVSGASSFFQSAMPYSLN